MLYRITNLSKIRSIGYLSRRCLSIDQRLFSDKPPSESSDKSSENETSIEEKKSDEIIEKTVTLDDLKKKEKPYEVMRKTTQKALDAEYAKAKARQALETPGETEARIRRE